MSLPYPSGDTCANSTAVMPDDHHSGVSLWQRQLRRRYANKIARNRNDEVSRYGF